MYTQVDLISNTVYIYLLLIFVYIAIGAVCYGFREYLHFKRAKISQPSEEVANSNWSEDRTTKDIDLEEQGSFNRVNSASKFIIAPSIPLFRLAQKDLILSLQEEQNGLNQSFDLDTFKKIEVFFDEVNTGETKSISEYLEQKCQTKTIYSLEQLHRINGRLLQNHEDLSNLPNQIKLSEVLKCRIHIPKTDTGSSFHNNKIIHDIRADLVENKDGDLATKAIALLRWVSVGAKDSKNNYFLNSFNELLEFTIDTGIVVNLLEKINNDSLRELFFTMIVNYCWEHWNFEKTSSPTALIQSRITLFRILCNLKLDIRKFEISKSSQFQIEFKVMAVIQELAKRTKCDDYLEIIPLIAQSVNIVNSENLKRFFYGILLNIIKLHGNCCMTDYISEPQLELKVLTQHGLWHKNDPKVIHTANEIFNHLVSVNSHIYNWYNEIGEGQIYVPICSKFPEVSIAETRLTTPWK